MNNQRSTREGTQNERKIKRKERLVEMIKKYLRNGMLANLT